MFPPKTKAAQEFVGRLAFSGYYFGKEICVSRQEAVQVEKEGESMWETGSYAELQPSQVV